MTGRRETGCKETGRRETGIWRRDERRREGKKWEGRQMDRRKGEQVILSGILPVIGRRGHRYQNCRGMAINMLVEKICREEEVGFVDLWGS